MALAKVYDNVDTLMVPIDLVRSADMSALLKATATTAGKHSIIAKYFNELADDIDNARIAACLEEGKV